jgi:integrase/recombinase XerD
MQPTDFSKSLTDFLTKHLPGERGLSHNTISSYKFTFILFITFMEEQEKIRIEKLMLKDITRDHVVAFLGWLQSRRNCSDATRNVRLAAIHSFFRYLQYEVPEYLNEWQRILSIKVKRIEKGTINYLNIDEIKSLLRQPDPTTKKGLRDLALLCLMYDSAARVQEIIDLTPSMIRLHKPYTIKLIGKGNKARIVPLMEQEVVHLKRYMESNKLLEKHKNLNPLFFNSRTEKFTRAGVDHILQCYATMVRNKDPKLIVNKISCHSLRHSKAMHLLHAGVHLVYIRDILGHESVVTTEIYARVDSKQKRDAIEKAYVDVVSKEAAHWTENNNLLAWLKDFK